MGKKSKSENVEIETGKVEDHLKPSEIKGEDLKPQAFAPLPGRPEPVKPEHALPQAEPEAKDKPKVKNPSHLKPQE